MDPSCYMSVAFTVAYRTPIIELIKIRAVLGVREAQGMVNFLRKLETGDFRLSSAVGHVSEGCPLLYKPLRDEYKYKLENYGLDSDFLVGGYTSVLFQSILTICNVPKIQYMHFLDTFRPMSFGINPQGSDVLSLKIVCDFTNFRSTLTYPRLLKMMRTKIPLFTLCAAMLSFNTGITAVDVENGQGSHIISLINCDGTFYWCDSNMRNCEPLSEDIFSFATRNNYRAKNISQEGPSHTYEVTLVFFRF